MVSIKNLDCKKSYSISDITMLLYGAPKIGKTTFCSRFDDMLIIATEPGVRFIQTPCVRVKSVDDILSIISELSTHEHEYKIISIDTVDALWGMCEEHVISGRGVECVSDLAYGKGRELVKTTFYSVVNRLLDLDFGVIFTSHEALVQISGSYGTVHKIAPSVNEDARIYITSLVDIVAYAAVSADGASRILHVSPSDRWVTGDRTGRLKKDMPFSYYVFHEVYTGKKRDPYTDGMTTEGTDATA